MGFDIDRDRSCSAAWPSAAALVVPQAVPHCCALSVLSGSNLALLSLN